MIQMADLASTSFFVNLPSNYGQHTSPENKASSFTTKIDLVRQLQGQWSVALVSISHLAVIYNSISASFDVRLVYFGRPFYYYPKQWRHVSIPNGYHTDVVELYATMMKAMESEHPQQPFGVPFTFDANHSKFLVVKIWAVACSPKLLHILRLGYRTSY